MTKDGFVDRSYAFDADLDKRLTLYVQRYNLRMTEEGKSERITKGELVNQAIEEFLKGIGA